jgi:uncharacterized protein YcbK (DUF882 family)
MNARTLSSLLIAAAAAVASAAVADPPPAAKNRTSASVDYPDMVRRWHARPVRAERARPPDGRAALVLEMVNTSERIELFPQTDRGGWTSEDIAQAAHALREPRSGDEGPIDPRILDLAYRIERHFGAPLVRVISAYRSPTNGRLSNHSRGRALDLVVPGVNDQEVARFARTLGFVGVGLYTRSGFIHLDTRPRSYFWVDTSGPGRRGRPYHVLPGLAGKADAQAIARGETPPSDDCSECENAPDPM